MLFRSAGPTQLLFHPAGLDDVRADAETENPRERALIARHLRDKPLLIRLADALAGEQIDAVYASPLYRASATGAAIGKRHGIEPVIVEDLQEFQGYRDLPAGKTVLDILGEDGIAEMRRRFIAEQRFDEIVYSETGDEFRSRVMSTIERAPALSAAPASTAVSTTVCWS